MAQPLIVIPPVPDVDVLARTISSSSVQEVLHDIYQVLHTSVSSIQAALTFHSSSNFIHHDQLEGVVNNWKGKYFEVLLSRAEGSEGT